MSAATFADRSSTPLRRIRRFQIDHRLTRESEAVADFYHHMYVPNLRRRFRAAAFIESIENIQWCVDRGVLLQVLRDGEVVGAAVLYGWGTTLEFLWIGLRYDLLHQASKGAFGALYYYAILYAFEEGYEEIDLSGTRALLNYGLVRFKRQWGAGLYDGWSWGLDSLMIRPTNFDPAVRAFLGANSWIARSDEGLVGKVLLEDGATGDQLAHITKSYRCSGPRGLTYYCLEGASQELRERAADLAGSVRVVELDARRDAIDRFCRR